MRHALLLLAAATLLTAADPTVRIADAWARATAPQAQVGGAFAQLVNDGAADDALIGASCPLSGTVELHTHVKDDRGVWRMSAVGRIPLPARQTTAMKPGGLHFMLMELKQPLREGATFPLTCRFANAGTVTIEVRILAAGSMGPQATAAPTGSPH